MMKPLLKACCPELKFQYLTYGTPVPLLEWGFFYNKNMDYNRNFDWIGIPNLNSRNDVSGVRYLVVTPGAQIIDSATFKLHARIDFDTDDALVDLYIKAAQEALEAWSQLSFAVRTMRFTALSVPNNFKLMFGPVDTITTLGFSNNGDLLVEGGENVDIQFTTLGMANNAAIQVAVARYAAGLYVHRENILDTKINPNAEFDASKEILSPFMNIIIF